MVARVGVVLVLVAGCGAAAGHSSTGHPLSCDPVIPSLFNRSQAFAAQVWGNERPELQATLADYIQKATVVTVQSCEQDRWSPEVLACLDEMTVTDDPHKCNSLFTAGEMLGLARRMMAVFAPPTAGASR
jgi:hypothetical protein